MDSDNGIDVKGNNGNTFIFHFPTPVRIEGVAYIPSEEYAENLKLIAAAPDLLETLEAMLFADHSICENIGLKSDQAMQRIAAIDNAREAIAKAKGGVK